MSFFSLYPLKQRSSFVLRFPLGTALVVAMLALMFANPLSAEGEDLSDNDTCLECHADTEREAPASSDHARVHNDDGSFIQEDHEMWSCTDCHSDISEIPHREGVERTVDCLECHDETPQ